MNSDELVLKIKSEIARTQVDRLWLGRAFDECLVAPRKIDVAHGQDDREPESLWLVFEESATDGYRVVFDEADGRFGLVAPASPHGILISTYDTFTQALQGM